MRFNHIDPRNPKRFFNSPLAFNLGHEVRKAAYTLIPTAKKLGRFVDTDSFLAGEARGVQQCKDDCATFSPNLAGLDGVRIPARLLQQAKGVVVVAVIKGWGVGLAGMEFGTGLAVARIGNNQCAPCAIGMAGISWGGKKEMRMLSNLANDAHKSFIN